MMGKPFAALAAVPVGLFTIGLNPPPRTPVLKFAAAIADAESDEAAVAHGARFCKQQTVSQIALYQVSGDAQCVLRSSKISLSRCGSQASGSQCCPRTAKMRAFELPI